MLTIPKKELIDGLSIIRKKLCGYASEDFCDCKFNPDNNPHGEHTGCPEIRLCMEILKKMTDKEYCRILKKKEDILLHGIKGKLRKSMTEKLMKAAEYNTILKEHK